MKKISKILIMTICVFYLSFALFGCQDKYYKQARKEANNYDIEMILDEESKKVNVKQKLEFKNCTDKTLYEIKLNIYANAYRADAKHKAVSDYMDIAYPNGKSFGNADIIKVKANGTELDCNVGGADKNILIVRLKSPLTSRKSVLIETEHEITLANIRHRLGFADEVFTLCNFYLTPCKLNTDGTFTEYVYTSFGDPFYNELSNFNVTFTTHKDLKVFSSGALQSSNIVGEIQTLNFKSELTRSFGLVASSALKTTMLSADGIEITYAYLLDDKPEESINVAKQALLCFTKSFGKLNKNKMTIVESPYSFGGMEFSNLVLITSTALKDRKQFEEIIVHELAHEWWYDEVGNDEVSDPWIDEALTEFSSMYFYYKKNGVESMRENAAKRLNSYLLYRETESSVMGDIDESIERSLSKFKTASEYGQMVYTKGSLMYYNLFELIGESKFLAGAKLYFKNNRYQITEKKFLVAAFSQSSKKDLTGFFDNWLSGNIDITQI